MTAKVAKGVPIPSPVLGKYPWRTMKKGDSFLIAADGPTRVKAAHAQVATAARRTGRRFTARYVRPEGGVRVWRRG